MGRLEECASQGLSLEGKLSAVRLTDEVSDNRLCRSASCNDKKDPHRKHCFDTVTTIKKDIKQA